MVGEDATWNGKRYIALYPWIRLAGVATEIILVIEGNTEMKIGNQRYKATGDDLYCTTSQVPHAIRNTGDKLGRYFTYQWE